MLRVKIIGPKSADKLTPKSTFSCTVEGWTKGTQSVVVYLINEANDSQDQVIDAALSPKDPKIWTAAFNLRRLEDKALYTVVVVAKELEAQGVALNCGSDASVKCPVQKS
jgi:hypothetical protein